MQAIILAAGMGKRLQQYTKNQTKCMVQISGKTLLEHACDALKIAGINKLILVVGYESEKLVSFAKEKICDMEISFVYNNDYAQTNNIYSLFLAREYLKQDDTILLESDLIFDNCVIKNMVENENENLALLAKYEHWMDGTVCTLDDNGNIREFVSKDEFDYGKVDEYYKTVNVYKFSKEFSLKKYIPFLETYINVYGTNQYYESVLKIIARINKMDLVGLEIGSNKWYEIDNAQDYDIASTMFAEKKLEAYEKHYGGYWRFPRLVDFCYLVNPYFPTKKLNEQIQYMFEKLVSEYPSGQSVQRLSAARVFAVSESNIYVGNGAAELINVLGFSFKGKVGLSVPVFNEYIRCFKNSKIVELSCNNDFSFNKDELENHLQELDLLVIVNPDNPSGQMLPKSELLEIIEKCNSNNVICIVDESFVDFAKENLRYTLIDDEVLHKYKNLVVIKSISKSYGVAGLRLGVLATENEYVHEVMKNNMPVWNINSFAEYFLEILPLYTSEYINACEKLIEERERFTAALNNIDILEVCPSNANFIMCKVLVGSSRDLAMKLLSNHNILIKDLSTKTGMKSQQFVRIAVKTREENDNLIKALRDLEGEKSA